MRIGIDCRNILDVNHGELAGVGHVVYYFIKALLEIDKKNEYVLFFYNRNIRFKEFEQPNVKQVHFPGLENIGKLPFLYRHIIVPHILRLYKLDVYHNPANVIPLFYFKKSVITVHDLAIYKNPSWFPNGQFFGKSILMPLSFFKAKKIIAVSQSTKDDLVKIFKIKPEKIEVIYNGVEDLDKLDIVEDEIAEKFKFKEPYFLDVSTIEPRKNHERLIRAFNDFLKQNYNKSFKLVLAGKKGWKYERVFATIKELKLEKKVIYLGYITQKEKAYLMKNCYAFVFPCLYEGFGLPVVEAMKLNAPIITSNNSSLPELVIDNALLINPYDQKAITLALLRIANDTNLRNNLIKKNKQMKNTFSWHDSAQKTLQLYKNIK